MKWFVRIGGLVAAALFLTACGGGQDIDLTFNAAIE